MVDEVYVIFKTHLDVGFTDFASNVLDKYINQFIPGVFKLDYSNFVWTTGSWLVYEYLQKADNESKKKMAKAIESGRISWHGLPFTCHTEYMTAELFEHSISLSKSLDARFGKKTISAKLTDVPGHTRGMVKLMANNGLSFLHIGKNPAATPPSVPDLFRWQDSEGCEIIVMYDKEYGNHSMIPCTGKAVYFAHTGDNAGPPPVETLEVLYKDLGELFPNAKLTATDLNTVAAAAAGIKEMLPIVTYEMGDTWIHGVGSDPRKTSGYRRLLRYGKTIDEKNAKKLMSSLLFIPEHTWGLDEKTHLDDTTNFKRDEFNKVRTGARFIKMERSWAEQRDYLTTAIQGLDKKEAEAAQLILNEYKLPRFTPEGYKKVFDVYNIHDINGYKIQINETGAICYLEKDGHVYCDAKHLWCKPLYEAFCKVDYDRFISQYLLSTPDWALRDNAKLGMDSAIDYHIAAQTKISGLYIKDNQAVITMEIKGEAHELYGSPKNFAAILEFQNDRIHVDFAWWDKPATRVAEAIWLGFCVKSNDIKLHKLGELINPHEVAEYGNRALHAVEYGIYAGDITIETIDAPLVAPGIPSLLNFGNSQPDLSKGVYFNLYNNVWATNFRMWYEEDARFSFVVYLK